MRARVVTHKGLYATDRAEIMLRDSRIEGVGCKGLGTLKELESRPGDDEMQIGKLTADRAIALVDFDLVRCNNLEPYPATVAAAFVGNHSSPQFSPAHGCGSTSPRIYGVALGQRARRTY